MIDFYFRHLWIWKVQDSQIWNPCGWEGWTLKSVFEDLIMIKIHTCALCKIFSFIVEGTTWSPWSTRATGSSWPTWSRYSRHRFGFWGNWPTRERWRTWPACKCRCVLSHVTLPDSLGYSVHSDEGHLNEVFWIVGLARFTRNWWLTRTGRSQRRKGK